MFNIQYMSSVWGIHLALGRKRSHIKSLSSVAVVIMYSVQASRNTPLGAAARCRLAVDRSAMVGLAYSSPGTQRIYKYLARRDNLTTLKVQIKT